MRASTARRIREGVARFSEPRPLLPIGAPSVFPGPGLGAPRGPNLDWIDREPSLSVYSERHMLMALARRLKPSALRQMAKEIEENVARLSEMHPDHVTLPDQKAQAQWLRWFAEKPRD